MAEVGRGVRQRLSSIASLRNKWRSLSYLFRVNPCFIPNKVKPRKWLWWRSGSILLKKSLMEVRWHNSSFHHGPQRERKIRKGRGKTKKTSHFLVLALVATSNSEQAKHLQSRMFIWYSIAEAVKKWSNKHKTYCTTPQIFFRMYGHRISGKKLFIWCSAAIWSLLSVTSRRYYFEQEFACTKTFQRPTSSQNWTIECCHAGGHACAGTPQEKFLLTINRTLSNQIAWTKPKCLSKNDVAIREILVQNYDLIWQYLWLLSCSLKTLFESSTTALENLDYCCSALSSGTQVHILHPKIDSPNMESQQLETLKNMRFPRVSRTLNTFCSRCGPRLKLLLYQQSSVTVLFNKRAGQTIAKSLFAVFPCQTSTPEDKKSLK